MAYKTILYETGDRVATITLNRPEVLNAINDEMVEELRDAYLRAEDDPEVWTVLVTGAGRALCAGADVTKIPQTEGGQRSFVGSGEGYLSSFRQWDAPQEATAPFREMAKPIICAVNGICCGAGLDLVTTSDIAIASDRATFFDPHVSIGIVSGREMVRLARALPINVAMRVALMGKHERMTAERAHQLGLVSEVVPHEQLMERTREVAAVVNSNAPLAVRGTRLGIRKGLSLPLYEAELLAESYRLRVAQSQDALEGPRSFLEKRDPRWQAR
jgi:enoyl-CoA hydratase/carnithine racemase